MTDYGKVEGNMKLHSMKVDVLRSTAQRLDIHVSQLQTQDKVQGWQGAPK